MSLLSAALIVAGPAAPAVAEPPTVVVPAVETVASETPSAAPPAPTSEPVPEAAPAPMGGETAAVEPSADGTAPLAAADPASLAATPPADENVIVVSGETKPPKEDPLARVNAQTYAVTQQVDQALVAPIAKGYEKGLPRPIRSGLRNFFGNLREPVVFLNFMLQGKVGKAFETLGRFTLNSTLGVAGLFDVAKNDPVNLPRRNNGFANTLGFYGVKPGAYLVLPLVGPTTVRDMFGSLIDASTVPTIFGAPFNKPYYGIPAYTINSLDYRIQMDAKLKEIRESDNPYETARANYLRQRQAEIDALHGRVTPAPEASLPPVTDATPVAPTASDDVAAPTYTPPPLTYAAPVDPANPMAWHSAQQIYLSGLQTTDGWQYLPGGLRWRRVAGDGSGQHPVVADVVTVHYAGTFIDGTGFDSSWERGEPATFPLGRLIPAWQAAIPQMGVGDTIELAAPATLAYGPVGKGPIPGGATLMFKVQLLGIAAAQ